MIARAARLVVAVSLASAPWPALAAGPSSPDSDCAHLLELFAIEHKLRADLKLDRARLRCGRPRGHAQAAIRELIVLRGPELESTIRLDRASGRLLTLDIGRLPLPELPPPKAGWAPLAALEKVARAEGEIPPEARLTEARYIDRSARGLRAGRHPYAELVFDHLVEGARVIGDRIVARVDLRRSHLGHLDARRWTTARAPDRRVTEGRAQRTARRAVRALDPDDLSCCRPPRRGRRARLAIATTMGGKSGRRRRRRGRGAPKRARLAIEVSCEMRHERRLFLRDRRGRLVEAYELGCVPACRRDGLLHRCAPREKLRAYVATEDGRLIGAKGALAPERLRWRPPRRAGRGKRPLAELRWRARKILEPAIARLEPHAEIKDERCPPTEDDPAVLRRCRHLMLPAMRYRSVPTGRNVRFEVLDRAEPSSTAGARGAAERAPLNGARTGRSANKPPR